MILEDETLVYSLGERNCISQVSLGVAKSSGLPYFATIQEVKKHLTK
jgi:hypothetical protein